MSVTITVRRGSSSSLASARSSASRIEWCPHPGQKGNGVALRSVASGAIAVGG